MPRKTKKRLKTPLKKLINYCGHPDVRPWLVFAAMLAVVAAFHFMYPVILDIPWFFSTLGWLIVTLSFFIIVAAQFFLEEATKDKGKAGLQIQGLYSYSRNPKYLAYILTLFGLGLGTGVLWFILIALATGPVLGDFVIPAEVAHLNRRFGAAWRAYSEKPAAGSNKNQIKPKSLLLFYFLAIELGHGKRRHFTRH